MKPKPAPAPSAAAEVAKAEEAEESAPLVPGMAEWKDTYDKYLEDWQAESHLTRAKAEEVRKKIEDEHAAVAKAKADDAKAQKKAEADAKKQKEREEKLKRELEQGGSSSSGSARRKIEQAREERERKVKEAWEMVKGAGEGKQDKEVVTDGRGVTDADIRAGQSHVVGQDKPEVKSVSAGLGSRNNKCTEHRLIVYCRPATTLPRRKTRSHPRCRTSRHRQLCPCPVHRRRCRATRPRRRHGPRSLPTRPLPRTCRRHVQVRRTMAPSRSNSARLNFRLPCLHPPRLNNPVIRTAANLPHNPPRSPFRSLPRHRQSPSPRCSRSSVSTLSSHSSTASCLALARFSPVKWSGPVDHGGTLGLVCLVDEEDAVRLALGSVEVGDSSRQQIISMHMSITSGPVGTDHFTA